MFNFGKKNSSALWKGIGVGAGLGAGLMFLLDPDRGRRRRALAKDKAIHLARSTEKIVETRSRDLKNRARGAAAQVRSLMQKETSLAEPLATKSGTNRAENAPADTARSESAEPTATNTSVS